MKCENVCLSLGDNDWNHADVSVWMYSKVVVQLQVISSQNTILTFTPQNNKSPEQCNNIQLVFSLAVSLLSGWWQSLQIL